MKVRNRLDSNIPYSLEQMTYRELVWIEHINNWIYEEKSKQQRKKMNELQN